MCEVLQNQVVSKWDQEMADCRHRSEHISLKSVFPGLCSAGRWFGKPDSYICWCQEWNSSVRFMHLHQMCWTQPWQVCELLCATGEQIEAATKTLEYKRSLLIVPVHVIAWALCWEGGDKKGLENPTAKTWMRLLVCHKMGHLVLSVILSLPPHFLLQHTKLSFCCPPTSGISASWSTGLWLISRLRVPPSPTWTKEAPSCPAAPTSLCTTRSAWCSAPSSAPASPWSPSPPSSRSTFGNTPGKFSLETCPSEFPFPNGLSVWRDIPGRSGCFVKVINKYILVDTCVSLSEQHDCIYFTISSKAQIVALRNRERPNGQSQYGFSFNGPWRIASYLALMSSQIYSFLGFLLKCQPKSLQRSGFQNCTYPATRAAKSYCLSSALYIS